MASPRRKTTESAPTTRRSGRSPKAGAKRGSRQPPKRGRRWVVWLRRLGLGALVVAILVTATAAIAVWHYGSDLPDVHQLRDHRPPQVTRVVDRQGRLLGESYEERRTVVPLERMPRALVLSVLAAEDSEFYQHRGLDYAGLLRAVVRGVLSGGRFRGTSTITQQLVKNLLLSPERSYGRKIRELLLARQLEQAFTKDEILELYLNHVNFGHGRYGVQEASQFYFGVDVEELTLGQASILAGIPQSPTYLSPRNHPEAARRRQGFVLDQLADKRARLWPDLSVEAIEEAREAPLELVELPERSQVAAEVMAQAAALLRRQVGEEAARQGGYTIHTSIDSRIQAAARASVREGLEAIDTRQRLRLPLRPPGRRARAIEPVARLAVGRTYDAVVTGVDAERGFIRLDVGGHPAFAGISEAARYDPGELPLAELAPEGSRARVSVQQLANEDDPEGAAQVRLELGPEGAVIVIDPRTREVLALVGGYGFAPGFDRATRALRQPGSTFKPFVYALGLRHGYTPASIVLDAPGRYDDWRPQNSEPWNFTGEVRLRDALARSINLVAIRVAEDVGPAEVAGFARELGIESELEPSLALALGASEVRLIELVNAYATFAAGGRWAPPRLITRIEGPDGQDVPLPPEEAPRDAMSAAEAYLITSMLESVVQQGTARQARQLRIPIAGKTGTSNEARDAWFVGYTPDLVAGVWVGFDDRRPLGRRESGGRSALPIWMEVIRAAVRARRGEGSRPSGAFPVPSGLTSARIDPASGRLAYEGQADAIDEYFLEGTVPDERATSPDVLDPGDFMMEQMGGGLDDIEEEPAEEGT